MGSVDFGIITALKIERLAICREFGLTDCDKVVRDGRRYWKGELNISDQAPYEVVVAQARDMANVESALLTSEMIRDWEPEALILAGIAGAANDEVALGDVVFGRSVYYYERGKIAHDGYKPEPLMYPADTTLFTCANTLSDWTGAGLISPFLATLELGIGARSNFPSH